uniref:RAN GTPase-activating protein 1 n=1 Tax=Cajanus cajan TaxID=3821 RepID=A0A151U4C5_CAJCA|nr:RAN GTPase-activating protein 1 [Cajanus cajan]
MDSTGQAYQHRPLTIKLWPPSRSTRLMLVERMTKNLTTPSIFSRKYGLLSIEEAEEDAKQIEDVAFATATQHFEKEPDGDGSSAVQIYAKESSKLMLEVLKRGPRVKEDGEAPNSYTKICFSNRSFGLDAARVTEPILISVKDQLKEVDLSDFIAGRPEAEALEVMTIFSSALEGCALRYLNLSNNALVSELLPSTEKLKVLQFHNNMTGDEGAVAIAEIVKQIYLSYLNLEDDGAEAIVNALKESAPSLEVLDLAGNDITAKAAASVAACISSKQFLTKLNLSENELKDEGAVLISKALEGGHGHLNEVDLNTNSITWSGARLLAEAVVQKPGFKLLNINANFISEDGIEELENIFKNSPDILGPLDENNPGGEDTDEEAEEDADHNELESKLKGLGI